MKGYDSWKTTPPKEWENGPEYDEDWYEPGGGPAGPDEDDWQEYEDDVYYDGEYNA